MRMQPFGVISQIAFLNTARIKSDLNKRFGNLHPTLQ